MGALTGRQATRPGHGGSQGGSLAWERTHGHPQILANESRSPVRAGLLGSSSRTYLPGASRQYGEIAT